MRDTEIFWNFVAKVGWGTKTTDYKKLRRIFHKEYSPEFIRSMKEIAMEKRLELTAIMDRHAIKETGSIASYWGVGDDGFWDLTAHIVGLGKEMYDFVCKNPIYAKTINYTENFEYSFNIEREEKKYNTPIEVVTPQPLKD